MNNTNTNTANETTIYHAEKIGKISEACIEECDRLAARLGHGWRFDFDSSTGEAIACLTFDPDGDVMGCGYYFEKNDAGGMDYESCSGNSWGTVARDGVFTGTTNTKLFRMREGFDENPSVCKSTQGLKVVIAELLEIVENQRARDIRQARQFGDKEKMTAYYAETPATVDELRWSLRVAKLATLALKLGYPQTESFDPR